MSGDHNQPASAIREPDVSRVSSVNSLTGANLCHVAHMLAAIGMSRSLELTLDQRGDLIALLEGLTGTMPSRDFAARVNTSDADLAKAGRMAPAVVQTRPGRS